MKDHQVVVISGETGCGKTTQVPQYILEEAALQRRAGHVRLVVTQPRRVAAISVAERVAKETGTRTGDIVGYQVRLDSKPPRTTGGSILYCTTGVLVSRLQSDSELQAFTHIILDEIHERDVLADILLVILKQIMHKRPDLKIILMSATLNASKFSTFMYDCPTLHVPGYMFPVEQFYLEDALEMTEYRHVSYDVDSNNNENSIAITEEEIAILASEKNLSEETCSNLLHPLSENLNFHLDLVADLIKHLDTTKPPGGILVFVPGWEEITVLGNMLLGVDTLLVLPLHGSMSAQDQRKIFQPAQKGLRKVVIATNIAESSVTINDIVYVVDCGKAKKKSFDVESNSSELRVDWISKANAKQRMGRAGRIRKGQVYKMYTKSRELKFGDFMVPEIVRCRLENVILKLKVLGCKNVDDFFSQLMDIPEAASVALAKKTLYDIGALKEGGELTGLGWTLGQLPSDPQLGKMMILGAGFSCLDPILSVVTSLEHKSPFVVTSKSRELAVAVDRLSGETASDHLAQANVMAAWDGLNSRGGQAKTCGIQDFTHDNFLSSGTLWTLDKTKNQLAEELHKINLIKTPNPKDPDANKYSGCEALVRAVVSLGLLPNLLSLEQTENDDTRKVRMAGTGGVTCQELRFSPRSCNRLVMRQFTSNTLAATSVPRLFTFFERMGSSDDVTILDSTATSPLSLALLAPNIEITKHPDPSADQTIDNPTKRQLGVLFENSQELISSVTVKAGNSRTRILLCPENVKKMIVETRSVLGRVLDQRCVGNKGCDVESDKIFNILVMGLYENRL